MRRFPGNRSHEVVTLLPKHSLFWIAVPVLAVGCMNYGLRPSTPPADAPAEQVALSGASVMIGVGDIAECGGNGDERTAHLVDSVLRANARVNVETAVFTLGDHSYPDASDRNLARCFTPSWGDPAKLIMKVVRPSIGNHDYQVDRGAPYYRYFGARAGPAGKGYYSYDVGEWHVVVLNSETIRELDLSGTQAQEAWLRKDLADSGKSCTLAYFHTPRFSSSYRRGVTEMGGLWDILYQANVDLILNGHDHHYERFRPQTPAGVVDTVRGMEQIIVGTGGAVLRGFRSRFGFRGGPLEGNSVVQIQGHFGVLILTLGAGEYRGAFLDTAGRAWDRSGRKCH